MSKLPAARADEYIALLTRRLPKKTLDHCISVAEHMVSFADRAGITGEQAATAGLLHDLCKSMQGPELLAAAAQYEIEVTDTFRETPNLLHGPVAAEECRRSLGIADPDVYDAIFWHTTGKPEWNRVGLALYFADFSEPLRTLPEAEEARAILDTGGFDPALHFVVDRKIAFVEARFTLDPASRAFADWIRGETL